ncbi:MAG TPA: indole-3-glycerol phosphate synthase TrpC [Fimbriimonadaceae bacterium]|jgi:indole-3-glycerol phosphate synthase
MSVLNRIFEEKKLEVAAARCRVPESALRGQMESVSAPRGFRKKLLEAKGLALIAEVKKASPSKGLIRPDFDPVQVATAYESAGAQCLSILTDAPNFQGSLENLKLARAATSLPCLRKDFIYDPYQVLEARAWGADAILLIVSMLEKGQLKDLHDEATELRMDVLVEVHDEGETDIALDSHFDLIGVNNRNLKTFETDLATSKKLIPRIAPHALAVSESALETLCDLHEVETAGAKAVLIGTAFCASMDIRAKVLEVMGWSQE